MAKRTANIGRLSVSLEANTAKYAQKLKSAKKTTKKNTDSMGNDYKKMGKSAKAGAAAVAVAVALVINETKQLAQAYVAAEREMRGFAEAAGMTTNELKANAYALNSAGLNADKIADIFKDTTDRIGEFAREGAGAFNDFVNTMKLTKAEGQELAQELQYMSGDEVLQYMASEMHKANVSGSQMTSVFEAIASDASLAAKALTENAEATQKLREEYSQISREADSASVAAFEEANKQTELFFMNLGALATDALAPAMETYAALVKQINKILPETAQSKNKDFGINTRKQIEEENKTLELLTRQKKVREELLNKITEINNERLKAQKELNKLESKQETFMSRRDGGGEQRKAQKDSKQSEIDNFTAQIDSIQKEINEVNKLISQIPEDRKRAAKEAYKELKAITDKNSKESLSKIQENYHKELKEFDDMYKKLYGKTKTFSEARDAIINKYAEREIAYREKVKAKNDKILKDMYDKEMQYFLGKEELLTIAEAKEIEILTNKHAQEMAELEYNYKDKLELESQFLAAKAALQKKHDEEVAEAKRRAEQENLTSMAQQAMYTSDLFNNMGNTIAAFSDESSKASQAMFAVAKGAAIAQAVINGYLSASQAWADPTLPFVAKAAAAAGAIANVAGLVSSIKSSPGPVGQAHDGMDNIPSEGTWILNKGERVLQPEANKDLTAYLNQQKASNSQGQGTIVVEAPMTVNGNVTDQKWFQNELIKHREIVAASVKKVEKERPLRRK